MAILTTTALSPTRRTSAIAPPVGAGNLASAPALDPSGLVPVNRVQPTAGTYSEVQRLTENRLGSMPPSSFSGAGAGFVPVSRAGPVMTPAVAATDAGMHTQQYGEPAHLSTDALKAAAMQRMYGDQPQPTADTPTQWQDMIGDRGNQMLFRGRDNGRRAALLARLQEKMPPEVFAALQQRLAQNDQMRAQAVNRPPEQSRADYIRQLLAGSNPGIVPPGLLGTAG
jgi:hypothetical protein